MSAPVAADRAAEAWRGADRRGAGPARRLAYRAIAAGLFFKWFSSLNAAASKDHPELNTANHSAAILNWSAPLAEFGSHAIVLAAADQDGNDLASVKAVKRSAMAGGAPPAAPAPCVVHRLVAEIRTPAANAQLSKGAATHRIPRAIALGQAGPRQCGELDRRRGLPGRQRDHLRSALSLPSERPIRRTPRTSRSTSPRSRSSAPTTRPGSAAAARCRRTSAPETTRLTLSARAGGSAVSAARNVTLTP